MNTAAIERFSVDARVALREGVTLRARRYQLLGEDVPGADALIEVGGRAITEAERAQRAALLRRIANVGEDAFVEQMAALWFNRLVAIRYMEVHDFLPSRTRIFSDGSGEFHPQAVDEVSYLDLPGLDVTACLDLKMAGADEPLFRQILFAQCAQLAQAMPRVFNALDAADALMLPDNLLAPGSVCRRLVEDLPDEEWQTVEVIGWAYQFYNAEVKGEVFAGFKKKRKAETVAQIGPATQLFTPEWIVRYMVENSLGRLWMLNNPGSSLRQRMRYYIEPEGQTEDFIRVEGPEDIRVLDPACGSGHILVYAFDLLAAMYEERGYRARDAARLIVEKNLAGLEIDERAGQLAILALTCKARELDRRFLTSGIMPDVRVLASVTFTEEELAEVPQLLPYGKELDVLAHLSEAGSLFEPTAEFVAALDDAAAGVSADDLMARDLAQRLKLASDQCHALTRTFDVCAGNPPYMGSGNFGPWLSTWTKKAYPDTKSDLCTMFIERNLHTLKPKGYSAQITMQSWMFLGSFEKLREKLLANESIVSMAHLGARGFDSIGGEVVSTTAFVTYRGKANVPGAYVRLVDDAGEALKEQKYLDALANPDCGYFYRSDATNFKSIPGTPIAYWASEAMYEAFKREKPLNYYVTPHIGIQTGNNESFVRMWWEVASGSTELHSASVDDAVASCATWFPIWKGGSFRRWSGNEEQVVNWGNDGQTVIGNAVADKRRVMNLPREMKFCPTGCWSMISSSLASFRYYVEGGLVEHASSGLYGADNSSLIKIIALLNSAVVQIILRIISPTLNFEVNKIGSIPVPSSLFTEAAVEDKAQSNIALSRADWDSLETSWDFKRNPLV